MPTLLVMFLFFTIQSVINLPFLCSPPLNLFSSSPHFLLHHSPSSFPSTSGVILVQPAAPENTLQMEDEESAVSLKTHMEKSRSAWTSIHPDHHRPASSPTVLPSGVILVQPAAAENICRWKMRRGQSGDTSTQKKKKKNCVRHFFSWMRKTFCCCCTINKDIEGEATEGALTPAHVENC
ncbi:uncharacterized protein LOC117271291 isoform X2 [Epinephelus lanceolatus]